MKKYFILIVLNILFSLAISLKAASQTIQGCVSVLEQVPQALYGSWAVTSVQVYTSNLEYSALPSVDYWNIYRHDDVLTLENPQTNARASVTLNAVKNNTVTFTRKSLKKESEITETPTITIDGENFWGTDKMIIKKYKNAILLKTDVVEFSIRGRKTGGTSTAKLLN